MYISLHAFMHSCFHAFNNTFALATSGNIGDDKRPEQGGKPAGPMEATLVTTIASGAHARPMGEEHQTLWVRICALSLRAPTVRHRVHVSTRAQRAPVPVGLRVCRCTLFTRDVLRTHLRSQRPEGVLKMLRGP